VCDYLFDSQVSAIFMESDGPDGGIRDYRAFSASVADVLICLRARDLGRLHCQKSEAAADANIRHIIAKQDLGKLAQKCYKQFVNADHAGNGAIKYQDLRAILTGMSALGLSDVEAARIARDLPRDSHGYLLYGHFPEVLEAVRCGSLKQAMVELRGSKLQRMLLEECKHAEERHQAAMEEKGGGAGNSKVSAFQHSGLVGLSQMLHVRTLSLSLSLSPRPSLPGRAHPVARGPCHGLRPTQPPHTPSATPLSLTVLDTSPTRSHRSPCPRCSCIRRTCR
jgi:hypothetical protein